MRMRKIFCTIAAALTCILSDAKGSRLSFNHISLEDGLSSVSTNDIWPDPSGVIWVATGVGLDCYDGNGVVTFRPPQEIHNGVPEMFTRQLAGSGDGLLYVMYSRHIGVLNTCTNEFKPFFSGGCNCIEYHEGLWIGHGRELLYSRGPGDSMHKEYVIPQEDGEITATLHSKDGCIWIGTSEGKLLKLSRNTDGWQPETISERFKTQIHRIYEDSRGTLWIGALNDGGLAISKDGRETIYMHNPADKGTISSNYIRDFCEDNLGNIWIGTYTGLDCLNPDTGNIIRYNPEITRHDAISHSSVWAIRKDRQGTMWVATYYGGVNYFNPEYDIFDRYPVSSTEGEGLSSPIISEVLADRKGNLWVATEGGGLNMIDRKSGRTTWYKTDSPRGRRLSENNIKDMVYVPEDNEIWVGIHLGGINRLDLDTGTIRQYREDTKRKDGLPSDDILNVADYGDSLIVRMKSHMCIMDKKTGRCRPIRPIDDYLSNGGYIRMCIKDSKDNIWVVKWNPFKLVRLAPPYTHEEEFIKGSINGDLCPSEITGMMEDSSGKIWIVSKNDGFYVYSYHDNTFTAAGSGLNFTAAGGYINFTSASHLAESPSSGNIICSSEDGFITFNPVTHKVLNYGKEKGFPLSNSHTQCITILDDSEIYIGGFGGLVSVSEKELETPRKPYNLFFTSLYVNGEKIETGTEILPESLWNTSGITLPASTKSIELYFSSSNHISVNTDPIEYCLEGFEKRWTQVNGERKISYTNLPPGKYRLLLRPSADTPADICPAIGLDITIRTPWYASWVAICIYILIIAAVILVTMNFYTSKVQMREKENLNQAKLRFFTNISHEIRTPLTIIIAEIEALIQQYKFSPAIYKKILGIYKNSLSLRELISELMEFRKQEQGSKVIKVAPHNLVFFINEFHLLFSEYAESKGISLSLTTDTDRLELWYDQTQMQKALNNILSNSIKFTPKGGSVTIRVYSTDASAVIEIADTGCGIPEKDLKKIFDRFYQVEYSSDLNTGTGIGLALAQGIIQMHSGRIEVESTEGNGSLFRITLPLGYSHFSREQMSESSGKTTTLSLSDKITIPADKPSQESGESEDIEKGHTIVIAEDNPGILEMLVDLFSPFYNVVSAADGISALEQVRKHHPSLVLSDVLMPGLSGTQLCKTIKNDPTLCHIPVVLLTARVEVEQNIEGLQQGADDYITKPFNSTLLLSRCNNLVNSRIMLQEKYGKDPSSSKWMKATSRMDSDFLERLTEIITTNLDNDSFDIDEILKTMGLSRTSFFRKLKAITGQTPSEYIQGIRLRKGADLLRYNPEMNISEISDAIGFNTPKYFAKCFKEYYGKSPLAWRKEVTETNRK